MSRSPLLCLVFAFVMARGFLMSNNSAPEEDFCPSPYVLVGDQCLMFFTKGTENYKDTHQVCSTVDGVLVAIRTATQFKHIVDHINSHGFGGRTFWVDGSDEAQEGHWVTSFGEAVPRGTPFWAAYQDFQQPDNSGGDEDCLEMEPSAHYYLNDAHCQYKSNFICELKQQKQVPIPDTPQADKSRCPALYAEVGDLCLMFVTWTEETWAEAEQTCGDNGELLAITDAEVLRDVYRYLHDTNIADHSFWLGGSDGSSEGTWVYTNGESVPMGTLFWGLYKDKHSNVQEPQGGTGENCLMLHSPGSHYFRDVSCSSRLSPLCKYTGQ